jgi:hypothetical protein
MLESQNTNTRPQRKPDLPNINTIRLTKYQYGYLGMG